MMMRIQNANAIHQTKIITIVDIDAIQMKETIEIIDDLRIGMKIAMIVV